MALNTSLKTRVSELDLINELFRGRVSQLEQSEAAARRAEMVARDSESRLRHSLDESQNREDELRRRISELEHRLGAQDHSMLDDDVMEPDGKKIRLSDVVEYDLDGTAKQPQEIQS